MGNISDYLDEHCISMNLSSKRKHEVITELVQLLEAAGKINSTKTYVDKLLEREKLSSTGIGQGIAIPHKLTGDISETMIAFGRKETKGINFEAIDKKPVNIFFLILGPEGKHTEHLKLLSKLSRLLHDRNFYDNLMNAQSPSDVLNIIREMEST